MKAADRAAAAWMALRSSTARTIKRIPWRGLGELIAVIGVVITAVGVILQYRQYEEEGFTRQQTALVTAWDTLRSAHNSPWDIGQIKALEFIARSESLAGDLRLNKTKLVGFNLSGTVPLDNVDLSNSTFCGSSISFGYFSRANLTQSLFSGAAISSVLERATFHAANFDRAFFLQAVADWTDFSAASLRETVIRGGRFRHADFQGADLRGLRAEEIEVVVEGYAPGDLGPGAREALLFSEHISDEDASFLTSVHELPRGKTEKRLVDFTGARFTHADIRGADLKESNFSQSQLDEACADDSTRLPSGLRLRAVCTPPDWVGRRRQTLQHWIDAEEHLRVSAECATIAATTKWGRRQ